MGPLLLLAWTLAWAQSASSADAAAVSYDLGTSVLHIPALEYRGRLWWVDLLYTADRSPEPGMAKGLFKVIDAGSAATGVSDFRLKPESGILLLPYVQVTGDGDPGRRRYALELRLKEGGAYPGFEVVRVFAYVEQWNLRCGVEWCLQRPGPP